MALSVEHCFSIAGKIRDVAAAALLRKRLANNTCIVWIQQVSYPLLPPQCPCPSLSPPTCPRPPYSTYSELNPGNRGGRRLLIPAYSTFHITSKLPSLAINVYKSLTKSFFFRKLKVQGSMVGALNKRLPPTSVTRVRFPYIGMSCGLSLLLVLSLLQVFFSGFSCLPPASTKKTNTSKFQFNLDVKQGHKIISQWLLCATYHV